jgi:hypothetical protein
MKRLLRSRSTNRHVISWASGKQLLLLDYVTLAAFHVRKPTNAAVRLVGTDQFLETHQQLAKLFSANKDASRLFDSRISPFSKFRISLCVMLTD